MCNPPESSVQPLRQFMYAVLQHLKFYQLTHHLPFSPKKFLPKHHFFVSLLCEYFLSVLIHLLDTWQLVKLGHFQSVKACTSNAIYKVKHFTLMHTNFFTQHSSQEFAQSPPQAIPLAPANPSLGLVRILCAPFPVSDTLAPPAACFDYQNGPFQENSSPLLLYRVSTKRFERFSKYFKVS